MPASTPYVRDPLTGESKTREMVIRLISTAGGPVDLPDGSVAPASVSSVLSPSVPVSQSLYKTGSKRFDKRYIGRASKVASSSNPSEELWCVIADVSNACKRLTHNEREVLVLRYIYDYADKSICSALNLTLAQVAETERSALDRLVRILDNA